MTTITLTNPWTGAVLFPNVLDFVDNFDAYLNLIDDDTIEAVNNTLRAGDEFETNANWLRVWAARVGPEEAGRILLGS